MSNRKAHRRWPSFRRFEKSVPVRHRRGRFTSRKSTDERYFEKRGMRRLYAVLLRLWTLAAHDLA